MKENKQGYGYGRVHMGRWIGFLGICVLLCGFLLIFIGYQLRGKKEEEKISEREVCLLLEELAGNEMQSIGSWDIGITVRDVTTYLKTASVGKEGLKLELENQNGVVARGLEKLKEKYGEEKEIAKTDWYGFFDVLGACVNNQYGTENGIHEEKIMAVKQVNSKKFVTNEGVLWLQDETCKVPMYEANMVMMIDDRILTVREKSEDEVVFFDVWAKGINKENVSIFYAGEDCEIPVSEVLYRDLTANGEHSAVLAKLVDIGVANEKADRIMEKELLKRDKVLSIAEQNIVLEQQGSYQLAEGCKVYEIYGGVRQAKLENVLIGYDYTEFAIDQKSNMITAALITQNDGMQKIRVLIRNSNYDGLLHDKVEFQLEGDFSLLVKNRETGEKTEERQLVDGNIVNIVNEDEMIIEKTKNRNHENNHEINNDKEVSQNNEQNHIRVSDNGNEWLIQAGAQEEISLIPASQDCRIEFLNLERSQESPSYRGTMSCQATDEGIVVVNELLLEEYLYAVLPSEMPSSYPLEALEAQAVCARTYAYGKMQTALYPAYGAHIDDSTTCQVYQNIAEQTSTNEAVDETFGEVLCDQTHQPVDVFYYSTSCGFGTTEEIWGNGKKYDYLTAKSISWEEENKEIEKNKSGQNVNQMEKEKEQVNQKNIEGDIGEVINRTTDEITVDDMCNNDAVKKYLSTINTIDIEKKEPWYRWRVQMKKVDMTALTKRLQKCWLNHPDKVLTWNGNSKQYEDVKIGELHNLQDLQIVKRLKGGVADQLLIAADDTFYLITGEQNIRMILSQSGEEVERNDGSKVDTSVLLPSGFLDVSYQNGTLSILGGGYGHGVGMSQNGASIMAQNGMNENDILSFFFQKVLVEQLYEAENIDN